MPLAAVVLLRCLGCSVVTFLAWRWMGAVGLVVCAPLFGVALARPLLEMAESTTLMARQLGYRKLSGRHYAHHGRSIDIAEDEDVYRWLSLEDVRKVVPGLPQDRVLEQLYPAGVRLAAPPAIARMRAEALEAYLGKATEASTLRFRLWLQREVILPARNRRQRGG